MTLTLVVHSKDSVIKDKRKSILKIFIQVTKGCFVAKAHSPIQSVILKHFIEIEDVLRTPGCVEILMQLKGSNLGTYLYSWCHELW